MVFACHNARNGANEKLLGPPWASNCQSRQCDVEKDVGEEYLGGLGHHWAVSASVSDCFQKNLTISRTNVRNNCALSHAPSVFRSRAHHQAKSLRYDLDMVRYHVGVTAVRTVIRVECEQSYSFCIVLVKKVARLIVACSLDRERQKYSHLVD
jgi:hypothetical protein